MVGVQCVLGCFSRAFDRHRCAVPFCCAPTPAIVGNCSPRHLLLARHATSAALLSRTLLPPAPLHAQPLGRLEWLRPLPLQLWMRFETSPDSSTITTRKSDCRSGERMRQDTHTARIHLRPHAARREAERVTGCVGECSCDSLSCASLCSRLPLSLSASQACKMATSLSASSDNRALIAQVPSMIPALAKQMTDAKEISREVYKALINLAENEEICKGAQNHTAHNDRAGDLPLGASHELTALPSCT